MINNRLAKTLAKIEKMSANEFKALMDRAGSKEPIYDEVENLVVSNSNFLWPMPFQSDVSKANHLSKSYSNELEIGGLLKGYGAFYYNERKEPLIIGDCTCTNDNFYPIETAA